MYNVNEILLIVPQMLTFGLVLGFVTCDIVLLKVFRTNHSIIGYLVTKISRYFFNHSCRKSTFFGNRNVVTLVVPFFDT